VHSNRGWHSPLRGRPTIRRNLPPPPSPSADDWSTADHDCSAGGHGGWAGDHDGSAGAHDGSAGGHGGDGGWADDGWSTDGHGWSAGCYGWSASAHESPARDIDGEATSSRKWQRAASSRDARRSNGSGSDPAIDAREAANDPNDYGR
jgi:hypothetical protein